MSISRITQSIRDRYAYTTWQLARFRDEIKGVAAIEFAFLAPLMLLLYVGTVEISAALSANRKLSRASSTMGDLMTQVDCITHNNLDDMVNIIDDIMYPFDNTVKIAVSGVEVNGSNVTVQWSKAYNGATKPGVGSPYVIPDKIKTDGNFLVAVKMDMAYYPAVGWFSVEKDKPHELGKDMSAINMSEEIFLRPRVGADVDLKSSC